MEKRLTCIECPNGCTLTVELDKDNKIINISGQKCDKGKNYATAEITNPLRLFTASVLAKKLSVKMVPVRTDRAIPKPKVLEAMQAIKKMRISRPVKVGEILVEDFLGLGVNLIATKDCR